jgi:undecaprenyl-phosphate 4-deoxy-4-formamido-L-arabinose transferase
MTDRPYLSIVIPVYNEEPNIGALTERLAKTLAGYPRPTEVIFVDDGSRDGSVAALLEARAILPQAIIVKLNRNYGQHPAVLAGFVQARGEVVVTLDADLQNPPEEIPRLVAKVEEGYDVVGGFREARQDTWFRRTASRWVNRMTARILGVRLRDYGCMLRAYARPVVDRMTSTMERSTFIPALACLYASRISELEVGHAAREGGESKYGLWKLVRLNLDLITAFSLFPIRVVSFFGIGVALLGTGFGLFLFVRRLIVGPESEGVFTLFAILFVFIGAILLALGLIGEYIGRIYHEVRRRPHFLVERVYGAPRAEMSDLTNGI